MELSSFNGASRCGNFKFKPLCDKQGYVDKAKLLLSDISVSKRELKWDQQVNYTLLINNNR